MRIHVQVRLKSSNTILPFDHQYYLASYIYRALESVDPYYALELHKPFRHKFFTFSYIMSKERSVVKEGVLIRGDEAYFFVSSPDAKFLRTLIEAMLNSPEIKIKNLEGIVSEIRVLEKPKFEKTTKFRTLSPILVRKPVRKGKKLRGKELYPTDKEFCERLASNTIKKFCKFYEIDKALEKLKNSISIKFLDFKPKRHRIINTYHRCVLGEFIVEGNKDLIEFGYDCGFGEKNSMGFGMVKKI